MYAGSWGPAPNPGVASPQEYSLGAELSKLADFSSAGGLKPVGVLGLEVETKPVDGLNHYDLKLVFTGNFAFTDAPGN